MYAEIDGNNIKLFGRIWSSDGPYVVSQISKLLNQNGDLTIILHTPGGSVIDGNLIYNAIAKAKANVTIEIAGLAASMGSIIMLAGKRIKMAENAFIMVHAPSGYVEGNAIDFENTAKLLRSMEGNFLKKLATKTAKTQDELKPLMSGDNWFSADEALAEGLIDEIVDPMIEESDLSAYQDVKMCAQLFAPFDAHRQEGPEAQERTPKIVKPNPKQEMKLSPKSLTFLGLSADATDAQADAAIEALEAKLNAANQTATEAQNNLKAIADANAVKVIDAAIASGKIKPADKEAWLADYKANSALTERALAAIPVKASLSERQINTPEAGAEGRESWTFDDYRKKDPAGLIKMKSEDPEAYTALQNKK